MKIKLAVMVGITTAVALAAVSLAPASTTPPYTLTATQGFNDTLYDANGNVISTSSGTGIPAGQPITDADVATVKAGWQTPTIRDPNGTDGATVSPVQSNVLAAGAPNPGCFDHKQYVIENNDVWPYQRMAIYGQKTHWCWDHNWHITLFHSPAFWEIYDWSIRNQENCHGTDSQSCYGWYYNWHTSTGGHYDFRQGHADINCLFGACFGSVTPYVELWVNAGPWYVGDGAGLNGGGGT